MTQFVVPDGAASRYDIISVPVYCSYSGVEVVRYRQHACDEKDKNTNDADCSEEIIDDFQS